MSCADIIARMKIATGPDRELDGDIAELLNLLRHKPEYVRGQAPEYTGKIDDALTLVPEGLYWVVGWGRTTETEPLAAAVVFRPDNQDDPVAQAEGETVAIQICIVALEAREVRQ